MFKFWLRNVLYLVVVSMVSPAWAGAYEDFFRAIRRDEVPAVQALLQRGFDPNSVDPQGRSGAILALMNESYAVASVLIAHPQFLVDQRNLSGESPLMLAALKALAAHGEQPAVDTHFVFTIAEEVGVGASSALTDDVAAVVAVDNGTTGPGQGSAEFGVTVAMERGILPGV